MFTLIPKCKDAIIPLSLMTMVFISYYIYAGPPGTETLVKILIDFLGKYAVRRKCIVKKSKVTRVQHDQLKAWEAVKSDSNTDNREFEALIKASPEVPLSKLINPPQYCFPSGFPPGFPQIPPPAIP